MPGGKGNIKPEDGIKTRFTSENQPPNRGRKPGSRAWKDVLEDMMPEPGYLLFKNVEVVNEAGKPTGQIIERVRVKMATQQMVAVGLLKKAAKGDVAAAKLIMERMDGRPTQTINGSLDVSSPWEEMSDQELSEYIERAKKLASDKEDE